MAYDARQGLYLPRIDTKNYLLGGMERGLDMRKQSLANQAAEQTMQQNQQAQLLGQQYATATGDQRAQLGQQLQAVSPEYYGKILNNEKAIQEQKTLQEAQRKDFLARSAYDILAAPKNQQSKLHDEMIANGIKMGILPQDATSEIGKFDNSDIEEMKRLVRGGQDFKDLTTTAEQDRRYKLDVSKQGLEEKKFDQQIKEFNTKLESGNIDPKDRFDMETKLRGEFVNQSKDFVIRRDAFDNIQSLATNTGGPSDIALLTAFMKLQDPTSTVREGEFATAENAPGVSNRVLTVYNKLVDGDKLTPEARKEFVKTAETTFKSAQRQHDKRIGQYNQIAKRAKLDPAQVTFDLNQVEQPATQPTNQPNYTKQQIDAEIARRKAAGLM